VTHPRMMSLVYRRHDSFTLRPTATHCNTLQHTATQIAKYLTSPQELECAHTHTQCNTVQHSATQCNTVQYTATHCTTNCEILDFAAVIGAAHAHTHPHTHTLQHNATHCNSLHHTAPHCNTLQHTAAQIAKYFTSMQ